MKASDIILQMMAALPKLSDDFVECVTISTMVRAGTTVTASTLTNHGLENGAYVLIDGAYSPNTITSLTLVGTTATAVTSGNHDLTEAGSYQPKVFPWNQAIVSGATETEYNGTFDIVSANNRKTFTYTVSGSPATPATGTPVLLQDEGFNGRYAVTVTGKKTFTYEVTTTPTSPAQGPAMCVKKGVRVSGALSLERAIRGYTKQNDGAMWAFVVLGDVSVSKDRSTESDATQTISAQNEFRQRLLTPFSVFVFIPSTGRISGRADRDKVEDLRAYIYKSLLGVKLPTNLSDDGWSQIVATGDRFVSEAANDAVYVHQFSFESVADVTYEDTALGADTVAFRDLNFDSVINLGSTLTGDLDADIDLDDEPL